MCETSALILTKYHLKLLSYLPRPAYRNTFLGKFFVARDKKHFQSIGLEVTLKVRHLDPQMFIWVATKEGK